MNQSICSAPDCRKSRNGRSAHCAMHINRLRRYGSYELPTHGVCEQCENTFAFNKKSARFCSTQCRSRSGWDRRKDLPRPEREMGSCVVDGCVPTGIRPSGTGHVPASLSSPVASVPKSSGLAMGGNWRAISVRTPARFQSTTACGPASGWPDWKVANRGEHLARKREYNRLNAEALKLAKKAHYEKNKEQYQARAKARYYSDTARAVAQTNEWVKRNREAVRAAKSRYKHARRALKLSADYKVTGQDLLRSFNRNGSCVYCGVRFADFREATWDHVIPVSRNGSFGIGNLVPACGPCNSSKNNKTVMEWRLHKMRQAV